MPLFTVYPASCGISGNDGGVGEIDQTELADHNLVAIVQLLLIDTLTIYVCAIQTTGVNDGIVQLTLRNTAWERETVESSNRMSARADHVPR